MRLLALGLFLFVASPAFADLPRPRLDRIVPLGGAAGSQVALEIAGSDLDEVKALHFDHPGLRAEFVKANHFRVTIAADVPTATFEVRTVGKHGISNARLFAVSRGLAEVLEVEPNDTPDKAQAVPLNCAVNGSSDANGDDFFRFPAKKGQRVTIDCQAFRLDSTLRASLLLLAADGRELLRGKPYHDLTDPFLDFLVPADGDYLVRLHDTTFTGGLPYRLVISTRPQIELVFPPAVVPGEKTELTVLGRNLPGGKPSPAGKGDDLALEQISVTYTVPQHALFLDHLAAPTLNARIFQARLPGLEDSLNPATLALATAPVVREQEPNDPADKAQTLKLPVVVCGRFDQPGDADWYSFPAKAGERIAVDLWCERLGRPGDPFVLITNDKGQELASFDDHGVNVDALAQFNRDPLGTFTAPADGTYRLLVQERYGHAGPRFIYALSIGKPEPGFYPVAFHETNPEPSCPTVRQGGSAAYEVCLNWRDFNGPVTIEAEGLPPGVRCPPVHVSPQGQTAHVVFTAAPDAADWAGAVRLKAWATIDGKRVEREVRGAERRWNNNLNACRVCREICLAVRPKAPYGVTLAAEKPSVPAGGTMEVKAKLARYWPDFKGKVQLTGPNLPPGFSIPTTEVTGEDAVLKLSVAGNVPPGMYTLVLRADAQVPVNMQNVRVADPVAPLTVTVTK